MPLADYVALYSTESRKRVLDEDYFSRSRPRQSQERGEALRRLRKEKSDEGERRLLRLAQKEKGCTLLTFNVLEAVGY